MNQFFIITFAWDEAYIGKLIKNPRWGKIRAENVIFCELYEDKQTKICDHTFFEEDDLEYIPI